MHLDLTVLVNVDVHDCFVFVRQVFVKVDVHSHITETLVLIVFQHNNLGTVYDILRYLIAFDKIQTFLQVFDFAFFRAMISHLSDTGLSTQYYFKPCLVAGGLYEFDAGLGKESLTHEVFHSARNVVAWNRHSFTHFEVGIAEDTLIVVVGSAFYFYACNLVSAWHGGI